MEEDNSQGPEKAMPATEPNKEEEEEEKT